jgi:hypothetical protein
MGARKKSTILKYLSFSTIGLFGSTKAFSSMKDRSWSSAFPVQYMDQSNCFSDTKSTGMIYFESKNWSMHL